MNIYWKAGIAIALVLAGFVGGCSHKQAELDRLKADYAEQVSKALDENRQLEKRLQAEADSLTQQYKKEKNDAEKTISDLRHRIADGSLRLSVRTEGSTRVPDGTSAQSGEAQAYIDRGTADALVGLTSRGDDAIRDLNQCIDRYNALRR